MLEQFFFFFREEVLLLGQTGDGACLNIWGETREGLEVVPAINISLFHSVYFGGSFDS